jgi:hypothetical protein
MDSSVPVSFFLKKSDIDENVIDKKDVTDKSTAYIIYQNNTLMKQFHEVMQENNALKSEKEELEEYNDKLEKGRTCLQGYVKNEHDTVDKYKKLNEIYLKSINKWKGFMAMSHVFTLVYIIMLCATLKMRFIIPMLCLLGTQIYWCMNTYTPIVEFYTKSSEIKELKETIAKNKKNIVYLDDLIDNI